ncbi:MAG: 4Fe-4S binding protein [Hyphomicrobiaceae bacterium]
MLFFNSQQVAGLKIVSGLVLTLLAAFFLITTFHVPAQSRDKGPFGHTRDDTPLEVHIGKLFKTFTADTRIGKPEKVGNGDVWPVFTGEKMLGYVFQTVEIAPLPGYSGSPFEALVAIDTKGTYVGVKIIYHEEPIFLGGYGVEQPSLVAKQYAGLKIQDTIKVRGPTDDFRRTEGYAYVDGISRATISIEVLNQSVVQSATEVATKMIEGFTRSQVAKVNLNVTEKVTWESLLKSGWLVEKTFTHGQVYKAFKDTIRKFDNTERIAAPGDMFADIHVAQVNVPTIGKYLLGDAGFERLIEDELKPGENAFILFSNGPYLFLDEDFIAGSVPSRLNISQGEKTIEVRDVYFYNYLEPDWPKDMPQFKQARLFKISAHDAFDPSLPWQLKLNVIRGLSRFSLGVTKSFPTDYKLPERFFIKQNPDASSTPLWLELWGKRWSEIVILLAGLGLLTAIAVRPKLVVGNAKQFKIFRWAFLAYTVGFIGYYTQGQLSVTHVMTLLASVFDISTASGLLLDPIIFILGIYVLFTLVIWGRGFFCGWLCPFGALQEMTAWLGEKLKLPQPKIAWARHSHGNKIKYVIFAGLVVVSFFSVSTAEVLAEVEPFKTAITLNFVRSWPFVVYALALLLASMFVHKFFCRYVCPLGAGLALFGKLRIIDSIARRKECGTPCQLCSVQCGIKAIKPTGAIDYDECIQCYDCVVIHDDKTQCVPLVQAEKRLKKQGQTSGQPDITRPSLSGIAEPPILATNRLRGTNIGQIAAGIALLAGLGVWLFSSSEQDMPLTVKLGTVASAEDVAQADISITPDGDNLPLGSGTHAQGKLVFESKCASCHGTQGLGGEDLVEPLVGGIGTLQSEEPTKTVGSFWPYATTLFDYIRRSMPLDAPLTLTDEEVYAVTAYLLAENEIIEKTAVMDAKTLPKVQMPNRAGFVSNWSGHTHK